MSIISLVLVLLGVGFILWLINTIAPIDPKIKTIINGVFIVGVLFWVLQQFGVISGHVIRLK